MTKKDNNKIISVVHPIGCGLDVHKDMVWPVSLSQFKCVNHNH